MDNIEIPAEIRGFLEGLIQDSERIYEPEMQEEMIKELFIRLDSFIISAIIEHMPPEHLDEFIRLNDENKPKEEIEQFVKKTMPNAEEVFSKAFVDFRELYLNNAGDAAQVPPQESN